MRKLIALLLATIALPAFAHPGHAETMSFGAGLLHPFTGLDHLLAMFAVGLWSATTTRRIWLAPLCFAGVLLLGAVLAANSMNLPAIEPMIAASVFILGLLIMARVRMPELASATLLAGFALFHGAAHGNELGVGVALAGMVIATALLHGIGITLGLGIKAQSLWWQRGIGASIALTGVGLAFNLV